MKEQSAGQCRFLWERSMTDRMFQQRIASTSRLYIIVTSNISLNLLYSITRIHKICDCFLVYNTLAYKNEPI